MVSYRVRVKWGKKGTAYKHARYDARMGHWAEREDLVAFEHYNMPEWSEHDPMKFWKESDKNERRGGSACREIIVSLPNALSDVENVELGRALKDVISPGRPCQVAIHKPDGKLGGIPNPHAHVLCSDRMPDGISRPPKQFFSRYNAKSPERGGCRKGSGGKSRPEMRQELVDLREGIADVINAALEKAGVDARVDHRSYKARGIERKPERHLGPARVKRMTDKERERFLSDRKAEASGTVHKGVGY